MNFEILSPSDQVALYLREQLFKGRWTRELPGTPALAAELEVDRKTITAALKLLETEGLLQAQGAGRPRRITLPEARPSNRLSIRIIPYENLDRQQPFMLEAIHRIEELGHAVSMTNRLLPELGMDPERVARYVKEQDADAWIILAASREVLEWFSEFEKPAFALFGRRRNVAIASVGPDKTNAMRQVVRRLIQLGHRRIVWLTREERRKPHPGQLEEQFLEELESHGITPGPYNLPDWEDNPTGFHDRLDRLFQHTPPSALIIDEAQFFIAVQQHLSLKNIAAPREVSLVCNDSNPLFDWCQPQISHIRWQTKPVVSHMVHWVHQISLGKNERKHAFTPAEFIEGGTIGLAP